MLKFGFGKDVPLEWIESGLIHWISQSRDQLTWILVQYWPNLRGSQQYCFPETHAGSEITIFKAYKILMIKTTYASKKMIIIWTLQTELM